MVPVTVDLKLTAGVGAASLAIVIAAGPRVEDECRSFIDQHGMLRVTQAMHTSAGNLPPPITHVIYVAGPDSRLHSDKVRCYEDLRSAFRNCLQYANDVVKVRSVSVPGISSGNSFTQVPGTDE